MRSASSRRRDASSRSQRHQVLHRLPIEERLEVDDVALQLVGFRPEGIL